jgi:MFS family permease
MGYFFSIQGFLYLIGCMLIPQVFAKTPPKLQMTAFLLLTAFGIGMMGPSQLLMMPNKVWLIALGMSLQAFGTAPAFSYAIPVMQNRCQVRYQIVEGSDEMLEGKLSDTIASLFTLSYALGAAFAPILGSQAYKILGYRKCMDFFMLILIAFITLMSVLFTGCKPYRDHEQL